MHNRTQKTVVTLIKSLGERYKSSSSKKRAAAVASLNGLDQRYGTAVIRSMGEGVNAKLVAASKFAAVMGNEEAV